GKVVDDEEVGTCVLPHDALEAAVELGSVELVEHLRGGHEDDAFGGLARLVGQGASQERLAGARDANEERVDSLVEEDEVVQGEVTGASLFSVTVEVEVETVDGVDLGKTCIVDAPRDGALDTACFLLVGEAIDALE